MNKVLKVYISHQGSIQEVSKKIKKDVIVVAGGYDKNTFENGLLKLRCDDSYCGLADKVVNLFKFVFESSEFSEYTHIYKLDEDMEFVKEIDFDLADYMGKIEIKENINRNHHIGRCLGHYWNYRPFEGEIYDWCEGGYGYIISRKAFEIVANKADGTKYPLEDVMLGAILGKSGISATSKNLLEYYTPVVDYYNNIKTYKDLKGKVWDGEGIPKWIYRSGPMSLKNLPDNVRAVYEDNILAKNPGYELFYFDDADCKQFIIDEWGQDYLDVYNTVIPTAYKADFFRYLLLYNYGGIWGDFTQVPWVTFNELTYGVDRLFCLDHPATYTDMDLYNAIMMVKPRDIVVNNAITISKANILTRNYASGSLDITGPVVLGQAFRASEYHTGDYNTKILVGTYNKTRILLNPSWDPLVLDENNKAVIYKKLGYHAEILYAPSNKHYGEAWEDKTVFYY